MGLTKALIDVGLVAVLGLFEGCAGFRKRFVPLFSEVSAVFPGRRWSFVVMLVERELRRGAREDKVEGSCARSSMDTQFLSMH